MKFSLLMLVEKHICINTVSGRKYLLRWPSEEKFISGGEKQQAGGRHTAPIKVPPMKGPIHIRIDVARNGINFV